MRQFIDEQDRWTPPERRIKIELVSHDPAIAYGKRWQPFQAFEKALGLDAAVGLHIADDDVGTTRTQTAGRLEHRIGLADTGRGAEENAQAPTLGARLFGLNTSEELIRIGPDFVHTVSLRDLDRSGSLEAIQGQIQLQYIDAGLADHSQKPPAGMRRNEGAHRLRGDAPEACDAGGLIRSRGDAHLGIQATTGGGDEVDRNRSGIARIGLMQRLDP